MSILYLVSVFILALLFFISLIEFITGAERQGLKFFFLGAIVLALIYWVVSSAQFSPKIEQFLSSLRETLSPLFQP